MPKPSPEAKPRKRSVLRIEYVDLDDLLRRKAKDNAKEHDLPELEKSFQRFGFVAPVGIDEATGLLLYGHGRLEELAGLRKGKKPPPENVRIVAGRWKVPTIRGVRLGKKLGRLYRVADNRVGEGLWDGAKLLETLLAAGGETELEGTGVSAEELATLRQAYEGKDGGSASPGTGQTLLERFLVPPFSVLDSRQGYWQDRKRAWIALGIRGEETREGILLPKPSSSDFYAKKRKLEKKGGRKLTTREATKRYTPAKRHDRGVSIFDPVLAELVFRWFAPPKARVLDPFAGGATEGVVAAKLGLDFVGIEIRESQVRSNRRQARAIGVSPTWLTGDAGKLDELVPPKERFDLVFSSPPFYDLERYGGGKADLSEAANYADFKHGLSRVLALSLRRLRDDRFAVFHIGEIRDRTTGFFRGLVPDLIELVEACGLRYYNEAIFVRPITSLAFRAAEPFAKSRKLGKAHENILVFYRGDPKKIGEIFPQEIEVGPVEVDDEEKE